MANPDIKIMLVDDLELVRTSMKEMLDKIPGFKIVGEASNGEKAIQLIRSLRPDVVLMDVHMPGMGGLGATRKLLRINPDVKILVVTIYNNDIFPSKLLQAGAFGYLTKGVTKQEMIRAIKAVHSGQRYISPNIASQLAIKHLTDTGDSPFESLSERELQVTLMITNGMQVKEISDKLCLSPKTVNSYRYRIFEKLRIQNDVELTHLAIRHGLLEDVNLTMVESDVPAVASFEPETVE